MRTISPEEFKKRYGTAGVQQFEQVKKPGFIERTKQNFSAGINKIKEAEADKKQNPISKGMKFGMGAIEAGLSPITAALEPVVKPTIGRAIDTASEFISNDPRVQKFSTTKAGEFTSRRAEDVANLSGIAGTLSGSKVLTGQVAKIPTAVNNVATSARNTITDATNTVNRGIQNIKPALTATKNTVGMVVDEAKRLPNRIATNVAEKQAVRDTINQLPSRVAKEAAQDGVDVADVKKLYTLDKSQSKPLRQLAQVTKDFAEGKTQTNPIEVVGRPIVSRLQELEKVRTQVGAKLGEVAEDLGVVTREELTPVVFKQLKEVPGLEGLTISNDGFLNFKNTVLATLETKADRSAIQSIFNSATKWGQGKNKHLLRQELFESLGGKKRAKLNLTATQEKAYEAIRRGLSDVLESKNTGYKNLSNQYRKVIGPLKEMRKLLKVAGEETDVMEMSAGLLARRLTSLAQSNPQIKAVLNAMDNATKVSGKTRLSIETLQDFYNILEKYYDVAPKTGFQAQVKQGIEKASGVGSYALEKVKEFAGQTSAVRQKALEKILKEILN